MARPTAYKPEYDDLTFKYCLLGATDEDLARYFGVSTVTINAWKNKQPSFLNAIKEGKADADANVANSLYRRALGYSHPEDKIFMGHDGKPLVVPTTKHYPPDTAAAFIWLKNRAGWKDKQDVEHSGGVTIVMDKDDGKL